MVTIDIRVTEYHDTSSRVWHNFYISYKSKQKENGIKKKQLIREEKMSTGSKYKNNSPSCSLLTDANIN
jgi:hypothetical protein